MTINVNNITNQGVNKNTITQSIRQASAKTGVDFAYLMQKAQTESNFDPSASAKTSSAQGLFQFIESTWLNVVKKHGDKHGMGQWADKITTDSSGRLTVTNPADKAALLALRNDPSKASAMAAELAKSNETYMKHHVRGFESNSTNLYLAHFMGANGASRFLNAMEQNPDQNASQIFKKEARANKGVFFDRATGEPRSLKEVYAFFEKKFDSAPKAPIQNNEPQMMANNDSQQHYGSTGFIMDDGTSLFTNMMPQMVASTSSGGAFGSMVSDIGFTQSLKAETLYFIQNLLSDLDDNTAFL